MFVLSLGNFFFKWRTLQFSAVMCSSVLHTWPCTCQAAVTCCMALCCWRQGHTFVSSPDRHIAMPCWGPGLTAHRLLTHFCASFQLWHPAHEVAASPASWLTVHKLYSCTLTSLVSCSLGAFDWLHRYPSARLNTIFKSDVSQKHNSMQPACPVDAYVCTGLLRTCCPLAELCTEVPLGLLLLWKKCKT